MNGPVYRICIQCGLRVNVSCTFPKDKKYLCRRCAGEPWYMTRESLVRVGKK